uniref:NTF2 domain-containing protein n=1 Tax=Ditylenchus dipsaci TaxID=166011 RepID=A0A915E741_9BILA
MAYNPISTRSVMPSCSITTANLMSETLLFEILALRVFTTRKTLFDKFGNLPFRSIQHAITKTDCQPLSDGSIFVTVFGQLKTDEDPINSFNHAFVLKPNPAGSFFISNEIFRLVLHDL